MLYYTICRVKVSFASNKKNRNQKFIFLFSTLQTTQHQKLRTLEIGLINIASELKKTGT